MFPSVLELAMLIVGFGHEVLNVPESVKRFVAGCGDLNEIPSMVEFLNT